MGKLESVVQQLIDALHEITLVQSSWESEASGNYHTFTLLSVGWGSLLLGSYDGRPTLGVQVSYGTVVAWCGPLFVRWPKAEERP